MRRPLRFILAVMLPLFVMGVSRLFQYYDKLVLESERLRVVEFIGLSAAGALCGVTFVGFIFALRFRNWKPESPAITEKQSPARLTSDAHAA